ncbi:MAG: hypothetical protein FOGNACKC_03649 [Anaerolineae bacterium]|nr:hypothetical protein [Anaerolineae bacterium]
MDNLGGVEPGLDAAPILRFAVMGNKHLAQISGQANKMRKLFGENISRRG